MQILAQILQWFCDVGQVTFSLICCHGMTNNFKHSYADLVRSMQTIIEPHTFEGGMAIHSSILAWRTPMDGGAWWATVHGVAQSWTWLKWLSTHTTSAGPRMSAEAHQPCVHIYWMVKSNTILSSLPLYTELQHVVELCCLGEATTPSHRWLFKFKSSKI